MRRLSGPGSRRALCVRMEQRGGVQGPSDVCSKQPQPCRDPSRGDTAPQQAFLTCWDSIETAGTSGRTQRCHVQLCLLPSFDNGFVVGWKWKLWCFVRTVLFPRGARPL